MVSYNVTKFRAANDSVLGALFVRDNGSTVNFSVSVMADPCPDVVWSFNGTRLGPSNGTYTYNNACTGISVRNLTWIFTLNLTLTMATSGNYSANFSNIAGTVLISKIYFTISGMLIKFYLV